MGWQRWNSDRRNPDRRSGHDHLTRTSPLLRAHRRSSRVRHLVLRSWLQEHQVCLTQRVATPCHAHDLPCPCVPDGTPIRLSACVCLDGGRTSSGCLEWIEAMLMAPCWLIWYLWKACNGACIHASSVDLVLRSNVMLLGFIWVVSGRVLGCHERVHRGLHRKGDSELRNCRYWLQTTWQSTVVVPFGVQTRMHLSRGAARRCCLPASLRRSCCICSFRAVSATGWPLRHPQGRTPSPPSSQSCQNSLVGPVQPVPRLPRTGHWRSQQFDTVYDGLTEDSERWSETRCSLMCTTPHVTKDSIS